MKVIIAGSRTITDYATVTRAVADSGFKISTVIQGGARGVDRLGRLWAMNHNVESVELKARWDTDGKAAGMIRNRKMAEVADALIAVWDGKSRGTIHMIRTMKSLGKPTHVHNVR